MPRAIGAAKVGRDTRVYDIRVVAGVGLPSIWRRIAISADATIVDMHLALLGAFEWPGDYGAEEFAYRVTIGALVFTSGKGSRTALRRVLAPERRFICESGDPCLRLRCDVVAQYEVPSRRHYPKVIDGAGMIAFELPSWHATFDTRSATWRAQSAARRELRY